ncbi:MAG: aminopeptidase P family protein, partial [Alphaproteobacteria bacterium]
PIGAGEYRARIAKVQARLAESGRIGFLLEPGADFFYLTGLAWGRSERFHGLLVPVEGEPVHISPAFEVPRLEERMKVPAPVLAWEEDEDPYALVGRALAKLRRGHEERPLAIAPATRFFIVEGVRRAVPGLPIADGAPVIRPLRMRKSAAEIALMQIAFDITHRAMREAAARIAAGMTPADIGAMIDRFTRAQGARPVFSLVQIGEASAYPHGSSLPQVAREGEIVLFDCGASVHGYQSDISRTFVFGEPTAEHRRVWEDARRAQEIAFAAARLGTPCAKVDRAARSYLESRGYGPGYRTPGLPHRTGHGIGLEGHEAPYFVASDQTPLDVGMCLSDEPGVYLPGRFGVRIEDCLYMTADGPRWFTTPPRSIDQPFG